MAELPLRVARHRESGMLNASNVAMSSSDSATLRAARFSSRCATDDVPGIRMMFGDLRSSHASDTCAGVARLVAAMLCSIRYATSARATKRWSLSRGQSRLGEVRRHLEISSVD